MEKSLIISDSEIDSAVDFVVGKVSKWTSAEISRLAFKNKKPRCIAINNAHYRVGKHTIKQISEYCWRLTDDSDSYEFMFKRSAIFYSLSQQYGKFELAFRILSNDKALSDSTSDFNLFQFRLKNSDKDPWKRQLYSSRKKQAYSQLLAARTQLQKSLRLATHYKLWKPI